MERQFTTKTTERQFTKTTKTASGTHEYTVFAKSDKDAEWCIEHGYKDTTPEYEVVVTIVGDKVVSLQRSDVKVTLG